MIANFGRIFLLIGIGIAISACQKEANREVVSAQTPDGHSFYFMPIDEEGVTDITFKLAWPTDWIYQSDRNPMVPSVASEAIVSGGTSDLAPQNVMQLFNDKNANAFLYAGVDHVVGELSLPREHIDQVVPVVGAMLANPQFDDKWVGRIKQGLQARLEQSQTQSQLAMWDAMRFYILGNQPIARALSQFQADAIDQITTDELTDWHNSVIVQDGVIAVVTGAISQKDAGRILDQLLSQLPNGQPVSRPTLNTNFEPTTIYLHVPDAEKTTLGFVGALPSVLDGNDMTDLLALQVLGDPVNGPLQEAIRTNLRATYGFQTEFADFNLDTRILFVFGEVEPDNLEQARDAVTQVYGKFVSDPDLSTLPELRKNLSDGVSNNVEYVDIAARTILGQALAELDVTVIPKLGQAIAQITAEDVKSRLVSSFPKPDQLIVIVAGPDPDALAGACVITNTQQAVDCR